MFDDEVRELVASGFRSGAIREFAETQHVFDLVEVSFPVGVSRIAWEKVSCKNYAEIFPVATGCKKSEDIEAKLALRREEVRGWFDSAGVSLTTEVSWVGDSTEIGLAMEMGTLLEEFPKLFALPQHSYVLPKDGAWCLNYVMEGELFFGRATKGAAAKSGGNLT